MKIASLAMMALALLAGCLVGCQSAAAPITVREQDAGSSVTIETGDTLLIELEGNITTGYNWVPAPQDPLLLNQVGEPEMSPESDRLGAPGTIVLRFQAVAQGQTLLHLDYRRPWETGAAPEKTFEVTVAVR